MIFVSLNFFVLKFQIGLKSLYSSFNIWCTNFAPIFWKSWMTCGQSEHLQIFSQQLDMLTMPIYLHYNCYLICNIVWEIKQSSSIKYIVSSFLLVSLLKLFEYPQLLLLLPPPLLDSIRPLQYRYTVYVENISCHLIQTQFWGSKSP